MSNRGAAQKSLEIQALNVAHNAQKQSNNDLDDQNNSFDMDNANNQNVDPDDLHNEEEEEGGNYDHNAHDQYGQSGNLEQEEEGEYDNLNHGQVAEQEEIPTDKDGLIEYLMHKLAGTEETINEAFESLQQEKIVTRQLNMEFELKKKDLVKIQQVENRPFKEKIHEKIEQTLEKAVEEKVKAENARNELKVVLNEREMMLDELDLHQQILHRENEIKGRELKALEDRVFEHDKMIESLDNKKTELETEAAQKDDEIRQLLQDRDDMRGVMRKLNDVKNVLNRLLSNPELLYAKDDKIIDLDRGTMPARNNQQDQYGKGANSPAAQNQMNKPGYMVNEDDFWYADPIKEPYAKDYGGRDKNYNEKYYYNQGVTQGGQHIQRPASTEGAQDLSNHSGSPTNLPPIKNKSQVVSRSNVGSNSSARNVNLKKKAY